MIVPKPPGSNKKKHPYAGLNQQGKAAKLHADLLAEYGAGPTTLTRYNLALRLGCNFNTGYRLLQYMRDQKMLDYPSGWGGTITILK